MATFFRIPYEFTIHYHLYLTIDIVCMSQQTMKNYIMHFVKIKVKETVHPMAVEMVVLSAETK